MMIFPGIVLLISILAIGRDSRFLAWHGAAVTLCLFAYASSVPALIAGCASFVGSGLSAFGVRFLERPSVRHLTFLRLGALVFMLLAMTALPHSDHGFLLACGFGVIVAGLFGALLHDDAVAQNASIGCSLNGLLMIAGISGTIRFVVIATGLYLILLGASFLLLRRVAWGRYDDDTTP